MMKQKVNMGENTKDAIFIDAERRFQELETETKKLHDESKKYFDAIHGMMTHQIEFSQAIGEIYKPISGRMSDPDSIISEGNPEGIEACEEYEAVVKDLLATLQPELEMIETRVIRPADELLAIVKVIRKSVLKRQHKQLDYDRHRATLKKLQDKKDRNMKDEKAMYKAENDVEQSTQDYEYYNELLKDELPKLFALEREFIRPLFQSFYYMQLNVFYTLHEKMQAVDIGYFNLTKGIEEGFEDRRGDIKEQAEALTITKFKTTGRPRPARPGPAAGRLAIADRPARESRLAITDGTDKPAIGRQSLDAAPPDYASTASAKTGIGRSASTSANWGTVAKSKGPAPPPPKPKPSRLSGAPAPETATALYDYEAQAEGDLSFSTGEVIEIVARTANENEWWTGKCRGKQGQFPGEFSRVLVLCMWL